MSAHGVIRSLPSVREEVTSALTLCENIGTVRSLTVYLLLKYGEWDQYVELDIDPSRYNSASDYGDDYLVTKVLSKLHTLPTSYDRRRKALEGFEAAEAVCASTNDRIDAMTKGELPPPDVLRCVHFAREHIRSILGELRKRDLIQIYESMRFGPGATTSLGGVVTLGKKFSSRSINTTSRLLDFALFCRPPGWRTLNRISVRESSKVQVVPKSCKVDRTICIEPDLNIFVQLGIGAILRSRLKAHGLDLNTQVKNQEAARKGSISDHLCTMDLSSASDLISREVVWHLLPERWCNLLHFARTDQYELDGATRTFHKWSSMGNGYTFELESLIFYGILLGCCEVGGWTADEVLAYGDDLVFPSFLTDLVTRTLEFLGFRVNREKTFGSGRFRESCGTDWFDGINVRPVFFKGQHHDRPSQIYSYANSLRRWAIRKNSGLSADARVLPAWLGLFCSLPRRHRHRIPEGFGEVGFVSSWDEARPHAAFRDRGWCGWSFSYRSIPPLRRTVDLEGAYIRSLHSPTDFDEGVEPLRGRYTAPLTKRGYVLTWPYVGPWL